MLNNKIKTFLQNNPTLQTPFVIIDLETVKQKYTEFTNTFNNIQVFYAIKCNPAVEIVNLLHNLGSSFDVASIEEVDLCLSLGVPASKLSWGSTIKKAELIKEAFNKGVNIFAFDSEEELIKIAQNAPASKVYCRIAVHNKNAMWPLAGKFGCSTEMAYNLLAEAKKLNLQPFGVSFHVGSQQIDPEPWVDAINSAGQIFSHLKQNFNIDLEMLNIGGGYPAYGYTTPSLPLANYKQHIEEAIKTAFATPPKYIFAEPGRFIVADAGVIKSTVVLVSKKDYNETSSWVYLDVGVFNGLPETMGECIKYNFITNYPATTPTTQCNIAGPTCDGADVMYKDHKILLPETLKSGDSVYIESAGGYTTTYASVCFNGFKPIKDYYIK